MQTNYQHFSVTLSLLGSVILSNTKLNNPLSFIIIIIISSSSSSSSIQFKYRLRLINAAGSHKQLTSYSSCDEHCYIYKIPWNTWGRIRRCTAICSWYLTHTKLANTTRNPSQALSARNSATSFGTQFIFGQERHSRYIPPFNKRRNMFLFRTNH